MALRSFAEGAVFAEAFGDGSPRVLALHGWGRRGADFKKSLVDVPALALDLPGFGASPPPADVIGAHGYADIVAPLLDEFDRPPVLIGHSFGGRIAVCLGAKYPENVGPILLTGAPVVRASAAKKPLLRYRVARSLSKIGLISDERMETRRRKSGSADYRAANGVMRDVLVKIVNESYEPELGALQSHVLMIWGGKDLEVPVWVGEKAAEVIRNSGGSADLTVLEDVGHLLPTEAPDRLRIAVDSLL
ncbi:MAG: alpha/beta hydrolase [Actinomycetota bacterium]|nr:alpha/beta hydrolase [Actinomycetota bacterium]